MDEAQTVLDRLERIAALDGSGAEPSVLVRELRSLLDEATAWSRTEGGDAAGRAVEQLDRALRLSPSA